MSINLIYCACIMSFILSIRFMASPRTALKGCIIGIVGTALAILTMMFNSQIGMAKIITLLTGGLLGIYIGQSVKLISLPQTVALFNGAGGAAAYLIATSVITTPNEYSPILPLGAVIGAITFSGSMIATLKLQGLKFHYRPYPAVIIIMMLLTIAMAFFCGFAKSNTFFYLLTIGALLVGIGGVCLAGSADMPVIISILNACSGWASALVGFGQNNILMLATGAIIGSGGLILAYVMLKASNRHWWQIFTAFSPTQSLAEKTQNVNVGSPEDAAFIMENAQKIIIVPGFGIAVASAQFALKNMADILRKKYAVEVKYAIHPVAGRMPGHINVLLAEAGVDYDEVYELEQINREFAETDVAYVVGANDITNPQAETNPDSPLYGMPILNVKAAKTVFFVKRSLRSGYSGVENPLFFAPNTIMLYGDAQKVTEEINLFLEQ